MNKYSFLIILFVILLSSSCSNEEETNIDLPITTMQEGYYNVPTSNEGIDQTFVKMGIKDTTYYKNRWCAFVGDSITILTATENTEKAKTVYTQYADWSHIRIIIYVWGEERLNISSVKPPGSTAKLMNEKPLFTYKGTFFISMQTGDDEILIELPEDGSGFYMDNTFFDYIWDEDLDLMVYHDHNEQY